MSNYPPGMTREDWKYIDGESHHQLCQMHEDYIGDKTELLCCQCLEIDEALFDKAMEQRAELRREQCMEQW